MTTPAGPRRTDTASRLIAAPTDAVYRAFESADTLMQWLPPSNMSGRALEYDFREGGRYRIELRYEDAKDVGSGKSGDRRDVSTGRFIELRPGTRIVQSVEFESDDPAFAGTMTMTWSFEPEQGATEVTVRATGVPSGISKADHDAGLKSSLDNLALFVERR
jgi:uncharacterized protein YndB with AHSA1/START domain